MARAPLPPDEAARLGYLRSLRILDTPPEAEFDALVKAASLVCGVPIALISLIDEDRQWFKANHGLTGVAETHRDLAFCAHAILGDDILEVPDATQDPRFADNDLVTGAPDIRFYAGAPITMPGDAKAGTLCVIDRQPRHLDDTQREILGQLAIAASVALRQWRTGWELEQAARELRESQTKLRRMYETIPTMLHSIDRAGRLVMVSDTWLAKLGYTREEVLGRLLVDFHTPASREYALTTGLPNFFRTGRADNVPYQLVRKTGEVLDIQAWARREDAEDGMPERNLAVLQVVTTRRRAEAALEAEAALTDERRRLSTLITATGVATWEWHVNTGELLINERWAELLGHTKAELEPVTIATRNARMHPADAPHAAAALAAHFSGERPDYEIECRMRHKDGHYIWVLSRGCVITRTLEGKPEWMFGMFQDISGRKAQEFALRESQEFLEHIGRLAKVGGFIIDIATLAITWSAEACRIHGRPPGYQPTLEEAIADYTPESQSIMRAALPQAIAGAEQNLELELLRPDGGALWIRLRSTTVFDQGRALRITGSIQDITGKVSQRQALERERERVQLAIDSGGIGIFDWDIQNDKMFWDDSMCRLYGIARPAEDAAFANWSRLLHPEDRAAATQAVRDAVAGIRPFQAEFRIIWEDGSIHHLKASGQVIRDETGEAVRMVGTNRDVSEARRLANELGRQHELLRVTLESIGDAVITTDAAGAVVWLNPVAERLTGWSSAEAAGARISDIFKIISEATREPAQNPVTVCLEEGRVVSVADQTLLIGRHGAECGVEDSAAPIRNEAGEILGAVLVFHDVTEQRQLAREMNYRASHDALTGLFNRAEFEVRLRALLHRSHGDNSQSTVLFIDLDQFKIVNDTSGHTAGDELLQQVARLLADAVRLSDTVARLGGDEFAIILDRCTSEQGMIVAQKICDRMEEFRFAHGEQRFRVGASIGLVPVDERWPSISAIIQAADSSCYAAKEAGRNRVHEWYDTDRAMRARHGETQWATRLAQALDEDGFVLFAQRIQQLHGAPRGIHAEILIRMIEPNGGLVPPGAFLPAAERFHLASRIDRWVLRKTIAWMNEAESLDPIATICVNLSGQSVGDRAFHRWAIAMLSEAGDRICGRLCLEITETAAITSLADAALFIEKVRGIGVRVALDDFGAGASSFGYLKTMPVDFLKIDGQFVRDLVTDTLDEAAVRCFADVAAVVGMKTVAEFVDDQAVLDKLRRMGIDYAQGYLIHKPSPVAELLALAIAQPAGAAD